MTATTAPYPAPGKCEGRSYKRGTGTPLNPGREERCQRPPTHWSEEKYAWLCDQHDRKPKQAAVAAKTYMMTVDKLKAMPTADAPGKTVGDILNAKRLSSSHAQHVMMLKAGMPPKPVTVRGGKVVDGHHTIAAAEDAGHDWLPVIDHGDQVVATTAPKTYATCPVCHRDVPVRGGFLAPHKNRMQGRARGTKSPTCPGSGGGA